MEIKIGIEIKERDVDGIISRIEKALVDGIKKSAKVVYHGAKNENRVVGLLHLDGEKVIKAINELTQTMKQLVEQLEKADMTDIDYVIKRITEKMGIELNASSLTDSEKAFLIAADSIRGG